MDGATCCRAPFVGSEGDAARKYQMERLRSDNGPRNPFNFSKPSRSFSRQRVVNLNSNSPSVVAITIARSGTLGPSRHVEAACRLCYHGSTSPCREVNCVNSCLREVLTQLCQQCLSRGVNTCQHLFERGVSTVCVNTVSTLIHGPCLLVLE